MRFRRNLLILHEACWVVVVRTVHLLVLVSCVWYVLCLGVECGEGSCALPYYLALPWDLLLFFPFLRAWNIVNIVEHRNQTCGMLTIRPENTDISSFYPFVYQTYKSWSMSEFA